MWISLMHCIAKAFIIRLVSTFWPLPLSPRPMMPAKMPAAAQ